MSYKKYYLYVEILIKIFFYIILKINDFKKNKIKILKFLFKGLSHPKNIPRLKVVPNSTIPRGGGYNF